MKNNFLFPALALFSLFLCFSCSDFHNRHNTNISVSESDDLYRLSAYFNKAKTKKVQRYINDCIKPNSLFESGNVEFDATATLDDKTRFYIKSIPGELKIRFDKNDNSAESYAMIKKIGEGIKEVLTDE